MSMSDGWTAALLFVIGVSAWKVAAALEEIQRLLGRLIEVFADSQIGTKR